MNQKSVFLVICFFLAQKGFSQETHLQDNARKLTAVIYSDSSWIDYKYDKAGNPIGKYRHQYCDKYLPTISLSGDSSLCFGDTVMLTTASALTYHWSTGDTTQSIVVRSAGVYSLTATYLRGCIKNSSQQIIVHPKIQDSITSPRSTSICNGDSIQLNSEYFAQYGWSTGDSVQSIWTRPTADSLYSISVTDSNGCSTTDSIRVKVNHASMNNIDITLCKGDFLMVGSQTLNQTGVYTILLTNAAGCDSVVTVNMVVNDPTLALHDTTICLGQSVLLRVADTSTSANLPSNLQTGLLAYYPFNGNTNDESGNNNTAISNGATLTSDRFGNPNSAYSFNGVSSYIQLSDSIQPPHLSINFWFKLNSDQPNQSIIRNRYYGYGFQWNLISNYGASATNKLDAFLHNDSIITDGYDNLFTQNVADSNWHQLALTYDGITFSVYIDSNNAYSSSALPPGPVQYDNLGNGFTIGRDGDYPAWYFNGSFDDLSIYNRALSALEVQQLYSLGQTQSHIWSTGDTTTQITVTPNQTTTYSYTSTINGVSCTDSVIVQVIQPIHTILNEDICAGTALAFNGQSLNAQGVYTDTLSAITGCDSIVTLNLSIVPNSDSTIYGNICLGQSYLFNGVNFSASGSYNDTLRSANGCDSIVTLSLTVWPSYSVSQSQNICNGSSYSFYGQSLTSTGTYFDTLTTVNGCDSIIELALTVNPIYQDTNSGSICKYDIYNFYGQVLSSAGVYSDTFSTVNGCDSIISVNLIVLPISTTVLYDSICTGFTFSFNGAILNTAGTYIDTLATVKGCDSIVTLNLTVFPISQDTVITSICSGYSYNFNGQLLTSGSTYIDTLTAINGCDSIVTLQLTVLPLSYYSYTDTICPGNAYNFNGSILSSSGTYIDTFIAANGCDSMVTLSLTVLSTQATTLTDSICRGQLVLFNGQSLSATGIYIDTLSGINGCDSFVTLNLTVFPNSDTTFSATICSGQSYLFNGLTLISSGMYIDTLNNIYGCDSIVTLTLRVQPNYTDTINSTICNGQTYLFYGVSLTNQGTYLDTLSSIIYGCDSIMVLNLTVNQTFQDTLSTTICQGASYLFYGQTLTTSGLYNDTLSAISGCDSIMSLMLAVLPNSHTTQTQSICAGQTYLFNGQALTLAGTYLDTLTTSSGCDSVVTLHLSISNVVYSSASVSICAGQSYTFNSHTLSVAGIYHDTLTSSGGCDSIVTLILNINNNVQDSITRSICVGDSFNFNGHLIYANGSYSDTLASVNGCDSIVHLILSVNPLAIPVIFRSGDTLHTGQYAQIQWYLNDTLINNQHNSTLIASQNGNYTVSVTDSNGCGGISSILSITGLDDLTIGNIELVPNPTTGNVTLLNLVSGGRYAIILYDMQGKKVTTFTVTSDNATFNISPYVNGLYQVQITDSKGEGITKQFVKY